MKKIHDEIRDIKKNVDMFQWENILKVKNLS